MVQLPCLFDARNAFVNPEIDSLNSIEIFKGLENFDDDARDPSMVLELKMLLHGLRKSAK